MNMNSVESVNLIYITKIMYRLTYMNFLFGETISYFIFNFIVVP